MANFAFIDSQNVAMSVRQSGWKIDWRKFRNYLRDKFNVTRAYVFLGFIPENESLYSSLREAGFVIIFKPARGILSANGKLYIKGNVDAELVLHSMIEFPHYEKAVIVTGDGDFHCLISYLLKQEKLRCLLIPDRRKFSSLLREFMKSIVFLTSIRAHIEHHPPKRPL